MRIRLVVPAFLMFAFSLACGGEESPAQEAAEHASPRAQQGRAPEHAEHAAEQAAPEAPKSMSTDAELKALVVSTPGTYGWETAGGKVSYDFFPTGKVHIQGPDGEATMWEGDWSIVDGKLTVKADSLPTETFTIDHQGDSLLLNGNVWNRYKP